GFINCTMVDELIKKIVSQYTNDDFTMLPIELGNINLSYQVITSSGKYFLQKINSSVFSNPLQIIDNHNIIYRHLLNTDPPLALIPLLKNLSGQFYVLDEVQNVWRMTPFIKSKTVTRPENQEQLINHVKMVGRFLVAMSSLSPSALSIHFPDFHNSVSRYQGFKKAVKNANEMFIKQAKEEINFINIHAHIFDTIAAPDLPLRIVHNDVKISNSLFSIDSNHVLGLIDWDTVLPGTILSDYGDMIRTSLNNLNEDDPNIHEIKVDKNQYLSCKSTFTNMLAEVLTSEELLLMDLAPLWMVLEQAMRFLTDYLQGSNYYKIKYPTHNLIRTKNQIALFKAVKKVVESI
ncbi:MAG: aminoglycoside phosphotransferase family protein, partial [Bacteroidota bacterium]